MSGSHALRTVLGLCSLLVECGGPPTPPSAFSVAPRDTAFVDVSVLSMACEGRAALLTLDL